PPPACKGTLLTPNAVEGSLPNTRVRNTGETHTGEAHTGEAHTGEARRGSRDAGSTTTPRSGEGHQQPASLVRMVGGDVDCVMRRIDAAHGCEVAQSPGGGMGDGTKDRSPQRAQGEAEQDDAEPGPRREDRQEDADQQS